MRHYTVLIPLTLQAGAIVGLTPAQATVRAHALRLLAPAKEGATHSAYEATQAIQFKAGEVIRSESALPKGLASAVTDARRATPARALA